MCRGYGRYRPVPCTVVQEKFQFLRGIPGKLTTEVPASSIRSSNYWGAGGILGKLRTEVPMSSIRSSNSRGILGKVITKVPKSSMSTSNSGSGILGKVKTEVLKSSMGSPNFCGGGILGKLLPKVYP